MAPLYAPFAANKSGNVQVSSIHTLYYETCGLLSGVPILFLHGGPGAGTTPDDRRYFDPSHYHSILFDQRGSGKSTPYASLEENTTWDLVSDIEVLRQHLRIEKWFVFGGSWGSALTLAYAEAYPERCLGLIVRGVFTLRREEVEWFNQEGAGWVFPDTFERYQSVIPAEERGDMIKAYHKRLTGCDEADKLKCGVAWCTWGISASSLLSDPGFDPSEEDPNELLTFAQIESHYFVNGGWMRDGQLIEEAQKIAHLPIVIVQGRYDMICPAKTSWDLYQALGGKENPNVEYRIIDGAGHSAKEVRIEEALVDAVDKFKLLSK